MKPSVIFLMGPTATGKTSLAMRLADQLSVDLISVDSCLVYRGMDIGSAKPAPKELQKYPHKLVDILDPSQPFSVAQFVSRARTEISRSHGQGRTPLLVGGTMLYFKALYEGMHELPGADSTVRQQLDDEARKVGWPAIHERLSKVDPLTAAKLHPNHSQRISRALEVYELTGKPLSELQSAVLDRGLSEHYDVLQLGLFPQNRNALHERISDRLNQMFSDGLIDEVRHLLARGDLHEDLPSIRSVGYRQVWKYLNGEYSEEEARTAALVATRQLAKRQLTWLRGWPGIQEIFIDDIEGSFIGHEELLKKSLNYVQ